MSTAVWSTGGLEWRLLGSADLQGMHALHLESVAGMAPQAVKPETRAFLQSLLGGRGRVLGGWSGEQLVAYGVLQHDLLPEDAPRELLGLPPRAGLCKLAGAAVHPAWRGGGLQRWLIQQRIALAGDCAVFATAAPCNLPSWHNLLAAGLMVRGLQYRYGGHARYLIARVPGDPFEGDQKQARELGPEAIDLQQQLLDQGWRGLRPGAQPERLCLAPAARDR
jgi:GNAT superfamily N-acetyltransferase